MLNKLAAFPNRTAASIVNVNVRSETDRVDHDLDGPEFGGVVLVGPQAVEVILDGFEAVVVQSFLGLTIIAHGLNITSMIYPCHCITCSIEHVDLSMLMKFQTWP